MTSNTALQAAVHNVVNQVGLIDLNEIKCTIRPQFPNPSDQDVLDAIKLATGHLIEDRSIKHRETGEVLAAVRIEPLATAAEGEKIGLALKEALRKGAHNFHGANLKGLVFPHGSLIGARLKGADLSGANLAGTNLTTANLAGADLSGANLYCANFEDADLTDANLKNTRMLGAKLKGAILDGADLDGSDAVGHTPLPDGSLPTQSLARVQEAQERFWR